MAAKALQGAAGDAQSLRAMPLNAPALIAAVTALAAFVEHNALADRDARGRGWWGRRGGNAGVVVRGRRRRWRFCRAMSHTAAA
jgi:hypothetical protein